MIEVEIADMIFIWLVQKFQGCQEPIPDRRQDYLISVPANDVSTFIIE